MLLILLFLILNLIILINNKNIAEIFNLYDKPDKFRKLHKFKVPLTGGIIILLNLSVAITYVFFDKFYFYELGIFQTKKDLIIFCISSLIFFFIGFIDDKYNTSASKRFLFIAVILFPIVYLSNDLIIMKIKFSFIDVSYTLPHFFSIFWTILCFLLFINALNMFDGINYQVGFYSIYLCLIFLINSYFELFFLSLILGLIIFLILNHKYKSFLGDSGSYLLSFIFSYFFIKIYNQSFDIKSDHIVLFMIIPGIDLIRLFTTRIIKGKNPFSPDRNHLHHILSRKFNLNLSILIIQSLIIIPSILGYFLGFTFLILILQIITYFYLINLES